MAEYGDVVTLFSKPSALLRQRQLSSGAESHERDAGSTSGASDATAEEKKAETAQDEGSTDADPSQLTLDQVHARLAELENAASPTQSEINAMLAQYSDYSSDDGEGDRGEEGEEDAESSSDDSEAADDEETVIMKVLVVGNARCGKTSTIRRFVSEDFSDEYVSTIGADFVEKMIAYDEKLSISLQLWDIAGQDRFAKFTRAYFRDAKGAVIVCDITRENTIDAVVNWKSEIDACCRDFAHDPRDGKSADFPVVMIANKSDLLLDPVSALNLGVSMQKCVSKNGIVEWFRGSAKNGESIAEAFECLIDCMVENHRAEKLRLQEAAAAKTVASEQNRTTRASDDEYTDDDDDSDDHIIHLGSQMPPPSARPGDSGYGCECH